MELTKVGSEKSPCWLDSSHSFDGGNIIPSFQVSDVPPQTVELALICHDPDAPRPHGFTHWLVYGIEPDVHEIGPDSGGRLGPNDRGQNSYFGPKPPRGHGVHHYFFTVYALSTRVDGAPQRDDFLSSYSDAIIAQARWVGMFE